MFVNNDSVIIANTNNIDKFNKKWDLYMGSEPNP